MLRLTQTLEAIGKSPVTLKAPNGSSILVLPHGGRIIGLFATDPETNFLWHNPALNDEKTAKAFYQSAEWHNSGGERTWLSPEIDLFFPDYPDTRRYWQPRELDPGDYRVDSQAGEIKLSSFARLFLPRIKEQVAVHISKVIRPTANPIRHETGLFQTMQQTEYAGYSLQTELNLIGGETYPRLALWNLLQLSHGGLLLAPTYGRAKPRVFFGNVPPGDLAVKSGLIRYRMRASGAQKLSIKAFSTTGRLGYVYRTRNSSETVLIVRNFCVSPAGDYHDAHWDNPEDTGYAAQACCISNELGQFSELEHHSPSVKNQQSTDLCHVWAFRGSSGHIRKIAKSLLSIPHVVPLNESDQAP